MGGSAFDVDDLTNKVDIGSQPGTMWSLSSSKPAHGLAELRDPNHTKLWQSDGLLPHFVNIQFARRTAVTHVSLYLNFPEDDSYTPNKIRIMAGTHFHDLVEVRTRELKEPSGWKHFVLDKFDKTNESDEEELNSVASSSESDEERMSTTSSLDERKPEQANGLRRRPSVFESFGVCRRHSPIYTYLVQISILSNHAAGKDTHIRGIRIFGPPTKASREKAKRDRRRATEGIADKSRPTVSDAAKREAKQRTLAHQRLREWVTADDVGRMVNVEEPEEADDELLPEEDTHISASRRLQLLSSVR